LSFFVFLVMVDRARETAATDWAMCTLTKSL
jgi:hypothetical protein